MGVTPFQQRVYQAVSSIPAGKVATYRGVADHIGCNSPRAVGQALKANPFAPRVPCHRVIAASLDLGGFQGAREGAAIERKRRMLGREGVLFEEGKLVESARVYHFRRNNHAK